MARPTSFNQSYGPHPRQRLDVYAPKNADAKTPVVVFWYGGSWMRGKKRTYRFVAQALVDMGFVAVLPDYRLYPEVHFPAFVEDGTLALKWIEDNLKIGDTQRMFLAGHSAGAYIAAMLAYGPHYFTAAGADMGRVAGFIGISGPYAFYPRPGLQKVFSLPNKDRSWLPVNAINAKTPALLLQGKADVTVTPRNAKRYAAALHKHGAPVEVRIYPFVEHMGIIVALLPGLRQIVPTYRDIKEFVNTR